MKRHVIILLGIAVSLFLCRSAAAQEVVVDPTHIGVAVENTASSLEEMITMIEEMFSLNGKLDDLYGLAEKAGEVADRFREVGYLVDMTDSYNDLLKRTYEYSAKVKSWAAEGDLYGYERQLRYFHSCEMQGIKLFNQYVEQSPGRWLPLSSPASLLPALPTRCAIWTGPWTPEAMQNTTGPSGVWTTQPPRG